MAKTKKKDNKTKELTFTAQDISYQGIIKVSLKKGNKVLSTATYHNEGKESLFKFLCCCLAGDYATANTFRPRYLRLYSAGKKGDNVPDTLAFDETRSIFVRFDTTPIVETFENYSTVTFEFMIPSSGIWYDATSPDINQFCLFWGNSGASSECVAYYYIKDDEGKLGALDLWSSESDKSKYNLFIEWQMKISNK